MINNDLKHGRIPATPELRKTLFSYDDGETIFEGFTLGETWNGWAMPYFTLETAEAIPHERHWSKTGLYTVGDGLTWEEWTPEYESQGPIHPATRAELYYRACATNTGIVEIDAEQLKELVHGYNQENS